MRDIFNFTFWKILKIDFSIRSKINRPMQNRIFVEFFSNSILRFPSSSEL